MNCPACQQPLETEILHHQQVDRCADCGGRWLDQSELGSLVRQTTPTSDSPNVVPCSAELSCPHCQVPLVPFEYAHDSGVVIHKCPNCDGVWLADGQLEQLARYRQGTPAEQRLGQAMGEQMQAATRWQFARQLLRSRVLSGLVLAAFLALWLTRVDSPWYYRWRGFNAILLLAFIWFPDTLGSLPRPRWWLVRPSAYYTTPGDFVALGGWLLLIAILISAWMTRDVTIWYRQ